MKLYNFEVKTVTKDQIMKLLNKWQPKVTEYGILGVRKLVGRGFMKFTRASKI